MDRSDSLVEIIPYWPGGSAFSNWKLYCLSDWITLDLYSAHQQCSDLVLRAEGLSDYNDWKAISRITFAALVFEME